MQPSHGDDEEAARQAFLDAENINPSEDDNVLVAGVESSPNAIGFFGYAYYQENADRLKTLSVDGIEATGENAESGAYPLARPLYIYSDATIMKDKPQVAAFINFFLSYVYEEIEAVGYFPASSTALDEAKAKFLEAVQ
jgi:phosphate transport system substrate-binding protein